MARYGTVQYYGTYGTVRYGVVWCGVVWYGMVWCGVVWCGVVWCGAVRCGAVRCGAVRCGAVWCGVVWCGVVWYGMVWYGMVWYGMVWYGMVWYGMVWYVVVVVVVRAPSTCRREKLPDTLSLGRAQGSSRPASRWPGVCRQRPRGGGGGSAFCLGGEGARVAVRGTTCPCDPGSLPRRGGGACTPVRNGGGMGGGMEGPPVRTCGAPVPLASSRRSPATGEGATSCAEVE